MANKPIDLPPVMAKIRSAFIARDSDYLSKKWALGGRLEELNARMDKLIATPLKLPISQQISLEAQWLINYTDDWTRARATLLRASTICGWRRGGCGRCSTCWRGARTRTASG